MEPLFLEYTVEELSILNNVTESDFYTEGAVYNVLDDLMAFIGKIINNIIAFGKKLKNDVDALIQKKEVRMKLKKLKSELSNKQDKGIKKVQMIDVQSYVNYYDRYSKLLMKKMRTLAKGNFKSKRKLESVVESIQQDLDDMNESLDYIMHNRINVPIKKAIQYVEDNLNGNSTIEKDFVEITHELKNCGIIVEKSMKNATLTRDEKIKKEHVSCLKRVINKITSTLGKFWQKFVMAVVFFFA